MAIETVHYQRPKGRASFTLNQDSRSGEISIDVQTTLPLPARLQNRHANLAAARDYLDRLYPKTDGWQESVLKS
jgi:hypothetical protein